MPRRLLRRAAALLLVMTARGTAVPVPAADVQPVEAQPVTIQIEGTDTAATPSTTAALASISADAIRLVGSETGELPLRDVRRLEVMTSEPPPAPPAVVVQLVGGGRLSGTSFATADGMATIDRADAGAGRLPLDLVALAFWPRVGEDTAAPAWLAAVPERPESDLVVVRRADGFECVECAIVAVGDDTVTVLLDGERIPVARDRVAGLRWLRPPAAPTTGARVQVVGGSLTVAAVSWSPDALVLDVAGSDPAPAASSRITLPAAWLRAVDYAAGRTVRLVDLTAESTVIEPFVPGLAAIEDLHRFFAPRLVPGAGSPTDRGEAAALLLRPRTVITWRVPAESRRFQATIRPAGSATSGTIVRIALDDREVFQHEPSETVAGAPEAVALDVSGVRRLSMTVEATTGIGGPVRLETPVFEK